jgi:hypothetical protein
VLGPDVPVAEGQGLSERELQELLRLRIERDVASHAPRALQRSLAEPDLDGATDLVEVDPHGTKGLGVLGGQPPALTGEQGCQVGSCVGHREAEAAQGAAARADRLDREPDQHVLAPDVVVTEPPCLVAGPDHRGPGRRGESLEHRYLLRPSSRRPACFLWTA